MLSFMPALSDLCEAGIAILLFLAWTVVGAAAGGRDRRREFDPLVGWAVLCLPFVLLGTLTSLSFYWIDGTCVAIVAGSCAYCSWSRIRIDIGGWGPYLALAFPFVVLVAPTDTYGWDQLSHWLPNTNYIFAFQHFPREGLPSSTSIHAGYPYGFALAIYWVEMAARLVGISVKTVGVAASLNVLLLAVAARMLVDRTREIPVGLSGDGNASLGRILFGENIWLAAGLSLLLMTALSPTFLPTNSISASADNPTSVMLLAIAFAVAPGGKTSDFARALPLIQLALLLALNVFLKEDDAAPAVALLAGRIVWDARSAGETARLLRAFLLASIPMLGVAALWHGYAYFHIPQGEMALRAPAAWRLDLLPRIAGGMTLLIISKIGFLVCVAVTLVFAFRRISNRSDTDDIPGSFSVIAATGFIGYNLFLAFAYVSIFTVAEAERQSALWRYETHLGLVLECAAVLLACTIMVRRRPVYGRLALPVAATMLAAPVIFAPVIRPDLDPQTRALRSIGNDVSPRIAGTREIYVVDQFGNGAPCPMIVYEAKTPVRLAGCVTKITPCQTCMIQKAAADGQFIWANGWSAALAQATGLSPTPNGSYLLKRNDGKWVIAARWRKTPTKTRGIHAIWQQS